jgi:hypothetical protein
MVFVLYGPMVPAEALPEGFTIGLGLTAGDVIAILPFGSAIM